MVKSAYILIFLFLMQFPLFSQVPDNSNLLKKNYVNSIINDPALDKFLVNSLADSNIVKIDSLISLGNKTYYYGIFKLLLPQDYKSSYNEFPYYNTLIMITSQELGTNKMKFIKYFTAEFYESYFELPIIFENEYGTIIKFPNPLLGNGGWDRSVYFLAEDELIHLDSKSWFPQLKSVVPDTIDITRSPKLDMQNLKMKSYLWKKTDSSCCPSGGSVTADIEILGDRIVLNNFQFNPDDKW